MDIAVNRVPVVGRINTPIVAVVRNNDFKVCPARMVSSSYDPADSIPDCGDSLLFKAPVVIDAVGEVESGRWIPKHIRPDLDDSGMGVIVTLQRK